MAINIIAACDNNYLIGLNGKLPWHIPADLKRFKALTTGHAVIMGRKTFESLGSKPFPDRTNLVVSKSLVEKRWHLYAGAERIMYSLTNAIHKAKVLDHEEIFIIGGASLYAEAIPIADRIYMTRVDTSVPVKPEDEAVFFPDGQFDDRYWGMISSVVLTDSANINPDITFQIFERRK